MASLTMAKNIEVGDTFGNLTVRRYGYKDKYYRPHYLLQCKCGSFVTVRRDILLNGKYTSCRDYNCKYYDKSLVGKRFGMLKVISASDYLRGARTTIHYNCVCDCGTEKEIDGNYLRIGRVKSCGCSKEVREVVEEKVGGFLTVKEEKSVFKNKKDLHAKPNKKEQSGKYKRQVVRLLGAMQIGFSVVSRKDLILVKYTKEEGLLTDLLETVDDRFKNEEVVFLYMEMDLDEVLDMIDQWLERVTAKSFTGTSTKIMSSLYQYGIEVLPYLVKE